MKPTLIAQKQQKLWNYGFWRLREGKQRFFYGSSLFWSVCNRFTEEIQEDFIILYNFQWKKTIRTKIKRGLRRYVSSLISGRQNCCWTCWKIWDQTLGPNFLWTPLKLWVQTKKRQTMQIEVHLVVRKMAQPLESDHCEEGMDKARGRNNIWSTSTARKQVDHYCGGPAGKNRQLDQEPLLFDDKAVFKANE